MTCETHLKIISTNQKLCKSCLCESQRLSSISLTYIDFSSQSQFLLMLWEHHHIIWCMLTKILKVEKSLLWQQDKRFCYKSNRAKNRRFLAGWDSRRQIESQVEIYCKGFIIKVQLTILAIIWGTKNWSYLCCVTVVEICSVLGAAPHNHNHSKPFILNLTWLIIQEATHPWGRIKSHYHN